MASDIKNEDPPANILHDEINSLDVNNIANALEAAVQEETSTDASTTSSSLLVVDEMSADASDSSSSDYLMEQRSIYAGSNASSVTLTNESSTYAASIASSVTLTNESENSIYAASNASSLTLTDSASIYASTSASSVTSDDSDSSEDTLMNFGAIHPTLTVESQPDLVILCSNQPPCFTSNSAHAYEPSHDHVHSVNYRYNRQNDTAPKPRISHVRARHRLEPPYPTTLPVSESNDQVLDDGWIPHEPLPLTSYETDSRYQAHFIPTYGNKGAMLLCDHDSLKTDIITATFVKQARLTSLLGERFEYDGRSYSAPDLGYLEYRRPPAPRFPPGLGFMIENTYEQEISDDLNPLGLYKGIADEQVEEYEEYYRDANEELYEDDDVDDGDHDDYNHDRNEHDNYNHDAYDHEDYDNDAHDDDDLRPLLENRARLLLESDFSYNALGFFEHRPYLAWAFDSRNGLSEAHSFDSYVMLDSDSSDGSSRYSQAGFEEDDGEEKSDNEKSDKDAPDNGDSDEFNTQLGRDSISDRDSDEFCTQLGRNYINDRDSDEFSTQLGRNYINDRDSDEFNTQLGRDYISDRDSGELNTQPGYDDTNDGNSSEYRDIDVQRAIETSYRLQSRFGLVIGTAASKRATL